MPLVKVDTAATVAVTAMAVDTAATVVKVDTAATVVMVAVTALAAKVTVGKVVVVAQAHLAGPLLQLLASLALLELRGLANIT